MSSAIPSLLVLSFLPVAGCRTAPSPIEDEPLTQRTADGLLNVGFLVVDGVYNTELTAPYDMFHHTVFHTQPGMRVFTVAPGSGSITTFEGLRILPDFTFGEAPPIDVLVVPSAEHSMDSDLENEALIDWVARVGKRARYVVSLCDGAFVLAAAGLLDGRQATTFPSDIPRLREMFGSRIDVLEDVSFVHDGPAITSVGGAKSFDAALYLCELLYGARAARGIAGGLVIDWDLSRIACQIVPDRGPAATSGLPGQR